MSVCIVTGAAGLIGSEAVSFFSDKFDTIVGIDNNFREYFFGEESTTIWNRNRLTNEFDNYKHHNIGGN